MKKVLPLLLSLLLLLASGSAIAGQGGAEPPSADVAGKSKKAKQKKANKKAKKKIRDGHYDGARGDGASVNATFCKNGFWSSGNPGFENTGKKWFVRRAKSTKRGFTAIVSENKKLKQGGFTIAIGKRGSQWLYGIASFDKPTQMGKVERTDATQDCADLKP